MVADMASSRLALMKFANIGNDEVSCTGGDVC